MNVCCIHRRTCIREVSTYAPVRHAWAVGIVLMLAVTGPFASSQPPAITGFTSDGLLQGIASNANQTVHVEVSDLAGSAWSRMPEGAVPIRTTGDPFVLRVPELAAPGQALRLTARSGTPREAVFELLVEDDRKMVSRVDVREGSSSPSHGTFLGSTTAPNRAVIDFGGYVDASHFIFFLADGYAGQWRSISSESGMPTPSSEEVRLYRARQVVIDYTVNTQGGTDLTTHVATGRVTVAHWQSVPHFRSDWQIWQRSDTSLWGNVPYLDWFRGTAANGFLDTAEPYDDILSVPESGYIAIDRPAIPGLVLLCRVDGNNAPESVRFGKLRVVDVLDGTP